MPLINSNTSWGSLPGRSQSAPRGPLEAGIIALPGYPRAMRSLRFHPGDSQGTHPAELRKRIGPRSDTTTHSQFTSRPREPAHSAPAQKWRIDGLQTPEIWLPCPELKAGAPSRSSGNSSLHPDRAKNIPRVISLARIEIDKGVNF